MRWEDTGRVNVSNAFHNDAEDTDEYEENSKELQGLAYRLGAGSEAAALELWSSLDEKALKHFRLALAVYSKDPSLASSRSHIQSPTNELLECRFRCAQTLAPSSIFPSCSEMSAVQENHDLVYGAKILWFYMCVPIPSLCSGSPRRTSAARKAQS